MPFKFYGAGTPAQLSAAMAAYVPAPADALNQDMRAAVFNMLQRLYDPAQGEVPDVILNGGQLYCQVQGNASERGWRLEMTMQLVKLGPNNQVSSASLPPATLGGATTGP